MREQVIATRGGRAGVSKSPRAGAAGQRPSTRRAKPAADTSRAKGSSLSWKTVLGFVPLALKLLLAVTFGLLAFVGYRTAASASFFKVRSVDVEGARRASREDIRAAVVRASDEGVWRADLEEISREVRELPWVRAAVVSRVLPAGLRVRVTEREPRVITRAASGKLVWVDDEGVALGAASPGDEDFFVRGLEEARTPAALEHNRARVALARELSREWTQSGLVRRVSEVNLDDLKDVRVQLSGQDAHVEVRLGGEEFGKRFRQALELLDAHRQTPRGPFITYVNVSQGKRAVIGTSNEAQTTPEGGGVAPAPREPAPAAVRSQETEKKPARKPEPKKRDSTARQPEAATRPRRVG